jgi:DNA repair protein RecO (recombination protein O)
VIQTDALVVRTVSSGESNLVATFFTEQLGKLSAIAFAGRRSSRRFAAIEPLHTLRIELADDKRDLVQLRSVVLAQPRTGYLTSWPRMKAACTALRLVRDAVPDRAPEPEIWRDVIAFLDTAQVCPEGEAMTEAAAFGVRLVAKLGWAVPFMKADVNPEYALRVVEETVRQNVT